jgi:hypothetical protein
MLWFAFTEMRERPFLRPGRWTRAAVIAPMLAVSAIRTNALHVTIAQKSGSCDDYLLLAGNLDVHSHFSSETGTSNTTVFTMPLR